MPFGDRLRDREADAEAGTGCSGRILAVKAVKQPVKLNAVNMFAGVCHRQNQMLFQRQCGMDFAAVIAVFDRIVEQNRRQPAQLRLIAAVPDIRRNLSGQRLSAPRKGINIINGKKYVVK